MQSVVTNASHSVRQMVHKYESIKLPKSMFNHVPRPGYTMCNCIPSSLMEILITQNDCNTSKRLIHVLRLYHARIHEAY